MHELAPVWPTTPLLRTLLRALRHIWRARPRPPRSSPGIALRRQRRRGGDHLAQNGGYLLALKFSLLVMSAMKPSVLQSGMDLPVQNSRRSTRIIPVRRRDWEGRSGKSGGVGEAGSRFSSLGCCLAMGDLSWLRFGFSPKWVLESILRWAITTDAPRSIRSASVPPVEGVRVDTGKTEASRISSATLHGVVFQNPMIPHPPSASSTRTRIFTSQQRVPASLSGGRRTAAAASGRG